MTIASILLSSACWYVVRFGFVADNGRAYQATMAGCDLFDPDHFSEPEAFGLLCSDPDTFGPFRSPAQAKAFAAGL